MGGGGGGGGGGCVCGRGGGQSLMCSPDSPDSGCTFTPHLAGSSWKAWSGSSDCGGKSTYILIMIIIIQKAIIIGLSPRSREGSKVGFN